MTFCQIDIHEKHFGDNLVINNLRFDIQHGEFLTIVGPSGVGKSTLLNLLGELDTEYSGMISFSGSSNFMNIAYVFQEVRLMPWLTIADNIQLVLPKSVSEDEKSRRVSDVLTLMKLQDYHSAYPNELSGGMQRRAAIARALVIKPQLLLMDEPFVSLDQPTAQSLRQYLLNVWQKTGATIVFITHDINEAVFLSDRILFLSNKPSRIIHELDITAENGADREKREIHKIVQQLHNDMPDLLSGIIHENENYDMNIKAVS